VKQPCSEVVGDMAKVLKCLHKWSQISKVLFHLRQVSQIPFPDILPGILIRIRQNGFGLVQEAIGALQRWPQSRCGLQSFRQQLV
jgi:hypothetical protein